MFEMRILSPGLPPSFCFSCCSFFTSSSKPNHNNQMSRRQQASKQIGTTRIILEFSKPKREDSLFLCFVNPTPAFGRAIGRLLTKTQPMISHLIILFSIR